LDQFDDGLVRTVHAVRDLGAIAVGAAEQGKSASPVVELGGVRVGLTAWTGHVNQPARGEDSTLRLNLCRGLADPTDPQGLSPVLADIAALRESGTDLVVVSLHWGFEYERLPDPRQLSMARTLVEAGADVILGHHPHLVQPVELLSGGALAAETRRSRALVAYSLGNFVSAMQRADWSLGLALDLRVGRVTGAPNLQLTSYTAEPLFIRQASDRCVVDLLDPDRLEDELPDEHRDLLREVSAWWEATRGGEIAGVRIRDHSAA
jgi:poly-gamma-glutamate synthesis protein (capsule biosynthesis protein)